MLLDIAAIRLRNFLSYGDYETEITGLDDRGPVLISGEVVDPDGTIASNGSGKSTITVAIVWCLFGRTFTKDRPGDNVINYFVGANCYVEIETTDGWIIRRTRKMVGHDDLTVYVDGKDETRSTNNAAQEFLNQKFNLDFQIFSASTFFGQMSKAVLEMSDQARKETLERLLGLDLLNNWALAAKAKFKELEATQEVQRRILDNLKNDVITYRDLVSSNEKEHTNFESSKKELIVELEAELAVETAFIADWKKNIEPNLDKFEGTIRKLDILSGSRNKLQVGLSNKQSAETASRSNVDNLRNKIMRNESWRDESISTNFSAMRAGHHSAEVESQRLEAISSTISSITLEKRKVDQDAKRLAADIKQWKDKEGTVCPSCKQEVVSGHVSDCTGDLYKDAKAKIAESKKLGERITKLNSQLGEISIERPELTISEIDRMEKKLKEVEASLERDNAEVIKCEDTRKGLADEVKAIQAKIDKINNVLATTKVPMSSADIDSSRRQYDDRQKKIERLKTEISSKKTEINPYDKIITEMKASLKKAATDLKTTNASIKEMNVKASHFNYLWRAYTDRNKIKKLLLSTMIPYLNQRIQYYLDCFRCPIKITFKDNLAVESSVWNYDYCSGGERRRIDLSIMFALHDLYLGIHGRQCNIMVLDEVDGRLDAAGIESFIDIVNNDFTKEDGGRSKPGTVFVISHRAEMADAFPSKILVKKDANSFSHLIG